MQRLTVGLASIAQTDPNQPILRRNYDRSTAATEAIPPRVWPSWPAFAAVAAVTGLARRATERIVVDWHTGLAIGGYDPVAFYTDGKPVPGSAGI